MNKRTTNKLTQNQQKQTIEQKITRLVRPIHRCTGCPSDETAKRPYVVDSDTALGCNPDMVPSGGKKSSSLSS